MPKGLGADVEPPYIDIIYTFLMQTLTSRGVEQQNA